MSTALASVTITPTMMAEAFWHMDTDQQKEFFAELARVIEEYHEANKPKSWAWSLGELQWFALANGLMAEGGRCNKAGEMLMTIAAPLYLNTLRASGVCV